MQKSTLKNVQILAWLLRLFACDVRILITRAPVVMALLIVVLLFVFVRLSHGAECGGAVTCACGDTVIDTYTVPANLTCSSTHGLVLGAVGGGKILDCNSKTISISPAWASGNPDRYGIYLQGATGAQVTGWTVQNCTVSGFRIGVRLREASNNTVSANTVSNNGDAAADVGYGIEVTQNSDNNSLLNNTVSGSGDEGIHDSGSTGTLYYQNTVGTSGVENYYCLGANDNIYTENIANGGSNAFYAKDCSTIIATDNQFNDKVVQLTGASLNNSFTGGNMGGSLRVDHYEQVAGEQASYRYPQDNTFTNVAITAVNDCLRIENATGTRIVGGSLATCTTLLNASSVDSAGQSYIRPTDITFVSGINPFTGTISVDGGVSISVAYTLDVTVQKTGPVVLEGAQVRLYDPDGVVVVDETTESDGTIPQQTITVQRGAMPISLARHRLLVQRSGYQKHSVDLVIDQDKNETVTLTAQ